MTDLGFKYTKFEGGGEEIEVDIVSVGSGGGALGTSLLVHGLPHVSLCVLQRGDDRSQDPVNKSLLHNRGNQTPTYKNGNYVDKGDSIPQPAAGGRTFRNSNTFSMVGGTCSGNNGNHIFPGPQVYEDMTAFDPKFDPLLPRKCLVNLETYDGETDPRNPDGRGRSGPFKVLQTPPQGANPSGEFITQTWKETISELDVNIDLNNAVDTSVGYASRYQIAASITPEDVNGLRSSPVTAAYGPADFTQVPDENGFRQSLHNKNFRLAINALVSRVVFKVTPGKEPIPIGVESIHIVNGKPRSLFVRARLRVLIFAGMSSPAILQRSGIGNAALLAKHKIPLIYDNPMVGENIAYGILVNMTYSKARGVENNLTDMVHLGLTNNNSATFPKYPYRDRTAKKRHILTTTQDALTGESIVPSNTTARTGVFLVETASRGSTYIKSADPTIMEETNWRLFEGAGDSDVGAIADWLIECGGPFTAKLREKAPGVWGTVSAPPPALFNDRVGLMAWVRANAGPTCHITGGCRMGSKDPSSPFRGVTDAYGYVHGVARQLMVGDCSAAAVQPDCNSAPMAYSLGMCLATNLALEMGWGFKLMGVQPAVRLTKNLVPHADRRAVAAFLVDGLRQLGVDVSRVSLDTASSAAGDDIEASSSGIGSRSLSSSGSSASNGGQKRIQSHATRRVEQETGKEEEKKEEISPW